MSIIIGATSIGIGMDLLSIICFPIAWKYFPDNSGLITGILYSAISASTTVYGIIISLFYNPNNLAPVKYYNSVEVYYPYEVTQLF